MIRIGEKPFQDKGIAFEKNFKRRKCSFREAKSLIGGQVSPGGG